MMAVPAKPQSRRNKPAPAIFANPGAAVEPFVSGTATFDEPAHVPVATVAAMVDPAVAIATVEQISVPAIGHAVTSAPETPDDDAPAAEPETTPVVAAIDATEQLAERTVETVTAHSNDTVSALSKGSFPMATAFDTSTTHDFVGDIGTRTKGAIEKSVKLAEEMTEFTKGNVEAIIASGRVAVKGIEALAHDAAETAKAGFEHSQTALKSFTQVKSPTELFQLQSDYAKSAFDQFVANASKTSEHLMKLMGEVAQPLSNRYALASEKVKSAAL